MSRVTAISSRANPLVGRLRKLARDPSAYRRRGEIWLDGEHLCAAFVERGGAPRLAAVTELAWALAPLRRLAERAAEVVVLPPPLMAAISALESAPPIGFVIERPPADDVLPRAPSVVLDRVQDAGNVGSILRSAAAFGFTQVIALPGCAAPWSPKVLRAGMGAHFALRVVEAGDPAWLDRLEVPLLATSPRSEQSLVSAPLPWPCAWLFGHEGQGIAPSLQARCAATLAIPQPGGEESLNVAAAAAVCFYESARRRATS